MDNNTKNDIIKAIDEVFDILVTNEVGRLPENIFVNYFLPYFCGEKSIKDTNILKEWISIAGAPSKEVAILDNMDREIFRVPALMDTNTIDTMSRGENMGFTDIFINYELQKRVLPVIGSNYLAGAMDSKFKMIIRSSSTYEQNVERWAAIFVKYNKIETKAIVSSTKTNMNSNDDDLE